MLNRIRDSRNFRTRAASLLLLWMMLAIGGCGQSEVSDDIPLSSRKEGRSALRVVATSFVLAEVCRQLTHDAVDVQFPIPAGTSGIDWKPGLHDIRRLQSADLVVLNGAGYEPWSNNLSLPRSRIVVTSAGCAARLIPMPASLTHQHGPQGGDAGTVTAWALWLDPKLVVVQARSVETNLKRLAPEFDATISMRTNVVANAFGELDEKLEMLAANSSGRDISILGDGPFYFYLCRRLGWDTVTSIDGESQSGNGGDSDKAATGSEKARSVLCFLRKDITTPTQLKLRQTAMAANIPIVEIDLCENVSTEELPIMKRLAENLNQIEIALQQLPEQR